MARIAGAQTRRRRLRLRLAVDLASSGDHRGRCGHYKAVFEKNPYLAAASFYQMLNLFDRAGKTAQLVELMNGSTSRPFRSSRTAYHRLLSFAPADRETSQQAQTLFRKAWAAFPETRPYLLRTKSAPTISGRMPESFDFACEAVLPNAEPAT